MNAQSLNQRLLAFQEEWEEKLLTPNLTDDKENHSDRFSRHIISRPFCFGVNDQYCSAEKKIMIVGQQTAGWSSYQNDLAEWPLDRIQEWDIKYTELQLEGKWNPILKEKKPNRSPFWNLFRKVYRFGWIPCWNNLDKVQRVEKTDELIGKQEKLLNKPITDDGKTLLQKEIELAKPDRIIFVVGPRYLNSLCDSMGLDHETMEKYKPTPERCCVEITDEMGLGILAFWSYHPNYLNRHKGKMEEAARMITKE